MSSIPHLALIVQSCRAKDSDTVTLARGVVGHVATRFRDEKLWTVPLERVVNDRVTALGSWEAFEKALSGWTSGLWIVRVAEDGPEIVLQGGDTEEFDLRASVPLGSGRGTDLLTSLVELGQDVWRAYRDRASFGPVFGVRPLALPYPRPRPPRHSTTWSLGDAAYLVDEEFHRTQPLGDKKAVERLKAVPLAPGLLREAEPGLLVIRCEGPADDGPAFARQRHDLEVCVSRALELPLHPEFGSNGDRRLSVRAEGGAAPPFTVLDSMRGIGFKAVTTSAGGALDEETRSELRSVLSARRTEDGRRIRSTMVIFPTREEALQHARAVVDLGATGAVYVGDDHRLWDPNPAGDWIPIDWDRA